MKRVRETNPSSDCETIKRKSITSRGGSGGLDPLGPLEDAPSPLEERSAEDCKEDRSDARGARGVGGPKGMFSTKPFQ